MFKLLKKKNLKNDIKTLDYLNKTKRFFDKSFFIDSVVKQNNNSFAFFRRCMNGGEKNGEMSFFSLSKML